MIWRSSVPSSQWQTVGAGLDTNPVTVLNKQNSEESRPRTRFITRDEFARLHDAASEDLKPILVIAVETGLRKDELLGLEVSSIDFRRRELHLEMTKTNTPRRVPLSAKALDTIRSFWSNALDRAHPTCSAKLMALGSGIRRRHSREPVAEPVSTTSGSTISVTPLHHGGYRAVVTSTGSVGCSATRPFRCPPGMVISERMTSTMSLSGWHKSGHRSARSKLPNRSLILTMNIHDDL